MAKYAALAPIMGANHRMIQLSGQIDETTL
jgi:hypothetical protein